MHYIYDKLKVENDFFQEVSMNIIKISLIGFLLFYSIPSFTLYSTDGQVESLYKVRKDFIQAVQSGNIPSIKKQIQERLLDRALPPCENYDLSLEALEFAPNQEVRALLEEEFVKPSKQLFESRQGFGRRFGQRFGAKQPI